MTSSRHACREEAGVKRDSGATADLPWTRRGGAAHAAPQWLGDLRRYFSPNWKVIVVVSFKVIW